MDVVSKVSSTTPTPEVVGERRLYFNHCYHPDAEQVALVEGQADAITFGEWEIPATALVGLSVTEETLSILKNYRRVFMALDNTPEAQTKGREIAKLLKGSTCLIQLPDSVKDPNEWLLQGATNEDAQRLLNHASHWLLLEAQAAACLEGWARQDALRELFQHSHILDEFSFLAFKEQMAKLGIKGRAFNELAKKAAQEEKIQAQETIILSDEIPLLSPALGFHEDVALVTVSIIERT